MEKELINSNELQSYLLELNSFTKKFIINIINEQNDLILNKCKRHQDYLESIILDVKHELFKKYKLNESI